MARVVGKLSALAVQRAKTRGMYGDGGGLYLQVSPNGSRSWVFRYGAGGKRYLGLGALHTITLAEARERAREWRKHLLDGSDPLAIKRAGAAARKIETARALSFEHCAKAYIASHRAAWRNEKHASQWAATLSTYVYPVFGKLPVAMIDTALVMRCLEPIWRTKPETATRVRGRIEAILSWAAVSGYRAGDNPARWRGHLDHLLPARMKVQKVRHHAALPYADIAAFVTDLRAQNGSAARALEFTILTAARTSEVIGATWREIDLAAGVWTIPAERMKAGREHRIPLSAKAVELLLALPAKADPSQPIFAGPARAPLSNMAMLALLRRMDRVDLTVHGFRSTFRDWAAECTTFPAEVAEAALAHVVSSKVEAAYRRGDLFEKRKDLMMAWATRCA